MGNIISVVAVLLSQRLKKPVDKIKPRMIRFPFVPVFWIISKAIRLCKFHFSSAMASRNPPMNKKMVESAYDRHTSFNGAMPNNGNKMIGNSATTGIGSASMIHQPIIKMATDKTILAFGSNANGLNKNNSKAKTKPAGSA